MECPCCEKMMEKGIVQSAREIFWSTTERMLLFKSKEDKGDVSIANGMTGAVVEGYICKKCKRVIIDY